ncbi:MAG: pantoate--beta-alanine ligase [Flavobacteriaceae bacterium]|nr:pantoate--beta-alanine ligase [Flavobacteriaceae bacterium]
MKVFKSKENLRSEIDEFKAKGNSIGFVPTMGALHEGHLSLVKRGFHDNSIMIVSIFVNPTQFDKAEDLDKYPRTLKRDISLLETVSKTKIWVYTPSVKDIYPKKIASEKFTFDGLEHEMEGKFRKGHFDGVGTVVKRLLEIIKPHFAYFGEKDFQQLQIIKKLVEKQKLNVNIVGCKIHREPSGLAMSSRNERLKPNFKVAAPFIYKTLKKVRQKFKTESAAKVIQWVTQEFDEHELLELEYFIIADEKHLKSVIRKSKKRRYRGFIAAYADNIRLIDNIALN